MSLTTPLTDAELDELQAFLDSDATADDCMDISMLDGYLTALAAGPEILEPVVWLPRIWGESEPRYENAEHQTRITELILRHSGAVGRRLLEGMVRPQLYIDDESEEEEPLPIANNWCSGFMEAIGLNPDAWEELFTEDNIATVAPIVLFGTEDGEQVVAEAPDPEEMKRTMLDDLPEAVIAVSEFFIETRYAGAREPYVRGGPKVGRNDACPCGSGKKFKQCCGA